MADQALKKLVSSQNKRKREEDDQSLGGILEYLQEVSGSLDSLENAEDFKVLIENVLSELDGKEILVISRNLTSRCFEKFIPFLNQQHLAKIFQKIEDKEVLWKLSTNPYASRVYQAFLRHVQNDEIQGELFSQLEQHGFWIAEDICDYISERNASFVFRDCLLFANGGMLGVKDKGESVEGKSKGGMGMGERLKKNKLSRREATPRLPSVLNTIVETCVLLEPNTVWDLIGDKFAAPCLQGLLSAIQNDATKIEQVVSKMFPENTQDIHQAITHFIACHTIEFALKYAPPNITKKLFENALKGNLEEYALHSQATYVIQTFISCIESRDVLLQILEELSGDKLAKIFDGNKGGVILCLVDKARQMGCNGVLKSVLDMLNCWVEAEGQSKALAPILITRNTGFTLGDVAGDQRKSLSYIGTTLLSYLLRFDKSNREILRPFIQSLSDLAKDKVIKIAQDKFGSRLFEAFYKSELVDETQKKKVFKKFKGSFAELSMSAPGSFIVETIFRWGDMKQKIDIMNELQDKINQIDSDRYGLKVSQNLDLKGFYEDKKAWEGRIKFKQAMRLEFEQDQGTNKQYQNYNDRYRPQQNQEQANDNQNMFKKTEDTNNSHEKGANLDDSATEELPKKKKSKIGDNELRNDAVDEIDKTPYKKQKKNKQQVSEEHDTSLDADTQVPTKKKRIRSVDNNNINNDVDKTVESQTKQQKQGKKEKKSENIKKERLVEVDEQEKSVVDEEKMEGKLRKKKTKKLSKAPQDLSPNDSMENEEMQSKNISNTENGDGDASKAKKQKKKSKKQKLHQEGLNIVQQVMGMS